MKHHQLIISLLVYQSSVAVSTVSDPSGSGRVDMLTGPVAAARAVDGKSEHMMYLIRGSVGAYALFLPIRRRIQIKKIKIKQSSIRFQRLTPTSVRDRKLNTE